MKSPLVRGSVLIIDDEPANLRVLGSLLADSDYEVRVATGGEEGIATASYDPPDLILLDIMMPGMDGLETMGRLRRQAATSSIPVIFVTALADIESKILAFDAGGVDFVTKPYQPIEVLRRVATHVELKRHRDRLEEEVRERSGELELINLALVSALESANAWRDDDSAEHIKRVGAYSAEIAGALGLPQPMVAEIRRFAVIHDIGKVAVPDRVLHKPARLDPEEFEVMKGHCEAGYAMLDHPGVPESARNIVRFHHEKWDGSGYPFGLETEDIPLEARIVALADVYDALRSRRVYKDALPADEAADIILSNAATHFDPRIVAAFEARRRSFEEIAQMVPDKQGRSDNGS
ncbi:MAG TPA: HD domain-containing phosphohydrolase [Rectinemataceae bacterium]|nr:HD domain-containing phosphohydrolase [Rectinemataceae bacterium]